MSVIGKGFLRAMYLRQLSSAVGGHFEPIKSLKRCRKGFRDKTTLRQHELEHTGQNVYFCDLCDLELNGISLDFHMREHSDQKYFTCSICDRHFSTKSKLTGLVLNLTLDG